MSRKLGTYHFLSAGILLCPYGLAQRTNIDDLEEQRRFVGVLGQRGGDGFIGDRLEADARAGRGERLCALLAGRGGGIHGHALAVGEQVAAGLVLGEAELHVVMILVLDHAEDEERGVRGVVRVGGGHQIEAGEGVDRFPKVVAGERRLALEIGD